MVTEVRKSLVEAPAVRRCGGSGRDGVWVGVVVVQAEALTYLRGKGKDEGSAAPNADSLRE
jgi:hypothetical protein